MVHLTAVEIDPVLIRLLPRAVETRVHSTFEHAIVCPLGRSLLLTVALNRWGLLPGGVLIEESDWAQVAGCGVARGNRVVLTARQITWPDRALTIELEPARASSSDADDKRTVPIRAGKETLQAARRFWAEGQEPETGLLEFRQASCLAALAGGNGGEISSAVARLIGLGPGLTPAGDDYLVGTLLALELLGRDCPPAQATECLVAAAVAAHVRHTTSISASYLKYALAGNFAALPSDFARRLLSGADWQVPARDLRRMGATSGRQAALGIIDTLGLYLA